MITSERNRLCTRIGLYKHVYTSCRTQYPPQPTMNNFYELVAAGECSYDNLMTIYLMLQLQVSS